MEYPMASPQMRPLRRVVLQMSLSKQLCFNQTDNNCKLSLWTVGEARDPEQVVDRNPVRRQQRRVDSRPLPWRQVVEAIPCHQLAFLNCVIAINNDQRCTLFCSQRANPAACVRKLLSLGPGHPSGTAWRRGRPGVCVCVCVCVCVLVAWGAAMLIRSQW